MEIMTAKDLRMLPLKNVIEKIYDMTISSAECGHTFVDFTMVLLLEYYRMKPELDSPENMEYIFEELGKLFPDVRFFERGIKNGKILWRICWKDLTEKEIIEETN
jgi:hypothetical protein